MRKFFMAVNIYQLLPVFNSLGKVAVIGDSNSKTESSILELGYIGYHMHSVIQMAYTRL
jgi:hypothetical protein